MCVHENYGCEHAFTCTQGVIDFGGIAPMFHQGAHHPTVLVVLQALTTSVGEVWYFEHLKDIMYVLFILLL